MKGRISETLLAPAVAAIVAAIATIRRNLPFLLALSPEERQTMLKMGPKSVKFVSEVKKLAQAHPELIPAAIDVSGFARDVDLVEGLGQFESELTQVAEGVEDTLMVAGSEAMTSALIIYGILQSASKVVPGLDNTVSELGRRWKSVGRRGAKGKAEPSPQA